MIQAIIKKGVVIGESIPAPIVSENSVLIKVLNSCISAGTEMSGVNSSGKSLIKRAMEQPQMFKKVFDMAKSDGISRVYSKIKDIDVGRPTGYSISGEVVAIGSGIIDFKVGDRVAAAGAGIANHAEYVDVPKNLVIHIPNSLSYKEASTVAIGGIALQGIRRTNLKLGEYCVIVGVGILGLLTVQMLKKSGIRVIVLDINEERLKLASDMGAELTINSTHENSIELVNNFTGGYGSDSVIVTASARDDLIISTAFKMCRKKGEVVLVGDVGLNLNRSDLYKDELNFKISTSYGPGRYDDNYEKKGLDYPYAYVRWTEKRNMAEYLRLLDIETIKLDQIITSVYQIDNLTDAFNNLKNNKSEIMTILEYSKEKYRIDHRVINKKYNNEKTAVNIGIIGTGNFFKSTHLPILKKMSGKFKIHAVMNRTGVSAKEVAEKFNAKYSTTDFEEILKDDEIDLVFITTRHDSHGYLVLRALEAGKHVFVEKPLAVNKKELRSIQEFYGSDREDKPILFVGFNRRFSPHSREIKNLCKNRISPLYIHYSMNAGYIPSEHWVHEDGGRIVGEACHIFDLVSFLTNSSIQSISFESLSPRDCQYNASDNKSMILKYHDGSIASIDFFTMGNKELSKERMELHFDGKTIILDNYQNLSGFGVKINSSKYEVPQKGHLQEIEDLYECLRGGNVNWPISLDSLLETTLATLEIGS